MMLRKWVQFGGRKFAENYHGPSRLPLRRTWQIVRMGSYAKMWTLYIYWSDGSGVAVTLAFPQWLGPWPESAGNEPIRKGKNDAK